MIGAKDECLEKVDAYVKAGCSHFIFMLMAPYDHDQIQAFAEEVVPAAR
jgi:alkanesulfonate monooxygenase SsuD/methylene tetrahydromethanopterin reductase-like flavin-dependent oxidoreductase (luciferase family)